MQEHADEDAVVVDPDEVATVTLVRVKQSRTSSPSQLTSTNE